MPRIVKFALVALAVVAPGMSPAQEVRMDQRPRPEAPQGQVGVPPGHDSAPLASGVPARDVRIEHDPAFIPPFVGTYETNTKRGQYGLSGWTSPNLPVGPAAREINGWFSLGFTLTWDSKLPSPPTAVR